MGKRLRKLWADVQYQTWGRKHVHGRNLLSRLVQLLPVTLREAVIIDAAVRATQPSVIGPSAYAGPDGLEFVHICEAASIPHGGMLWPGPETHHLRERAAKLAAQAHAEGAGWLRDMPNPTEEQMASPEFLALWARMKSWDVNVPEFYEGYCGVNGSHVMLVLNALDSTPVARTAADLYDNRLGWDDGRNPYAPRAFWAALGMALGRDTSWIEETEDADEAASTRAAAVHLLAEASRR